MRFFVYISLIAALLVSFVPAQALQAATVVEPANMQGWAVVDDNGNGLGWGDFVNGPKTAPLGKGSAHLELTDNSAGWMLGAILSPGTKLADISRLEYSTYVAANLNSQAIALQFDFDFDVTDQDTTYVGRLVYEPYLNGTVLTGQWQEWDTISKDENNNKDAEWYFSRAVYHNICSPTDRCTWGELVTAYPNMGLRADFGGIIFKAGSGWGATFDGNVDKLVFGVGETVETFDFEPPSIVYVDDDWSAVKYNTDPDGTGPAYRMGFDAFVNVKGAVEHVATGGTIKIAAGSYQEQVIVRNLNGITIEGAGEALTTIKSPATLISTVGTDRKPVVFVENSENVVIKNLTVDGAGMGNANNKLYGVFYHNASGTIDNLTVKAVRHTPLNGVQGGVAVFGFNEDAGVRTITATNNILLDYQKSGFVFSGAGLNAVVMNNTVTGMGSTEIIAMNGIQVSGGANAVITGNTVSGHYYGNTNWASAGILTFGGVIDVQNNTVTGNNLGITMMDSDTNMVGNHVASNDWGIAQDGGAASIFSNDIIDNEWGIDVYTVDATYTADATINYNRIFGNTHGVANEIAVAEGAEVPAIDANNNWWGCNAGPNATGCDTSEGSVTDDTWLVLTLTSDETHVLDGRPANLAATLMINNKGTDVSDVANFPNGEPVGFSATIGTVEPASVPVLDGAAASVLTVDKGQSLSDTTISATFDNQTVTLKLRAGLASIFLPVINR